MTKRPVVATFGLLAVAMTTGCDGDGSTTASVPAGADLVVEAEDVDFDADTYEVPAGDVTMALRNAGSLRHTLVLEGVDGFKLEVGADGDVDTDSVVLDPGRYEMWCDVPGHRAAGMEATLNVVGPEADHTNPRPAPSTS